MTKDAGAGAGRPGAGPPGVGPPGVGPDGGSGKGSGAGAGPGSGSGPDTGTDGGAGADAVAEVFAALADPTRRRILDALAAHGEATATVLAAELPVSRQAIVKHLGVLDRAGLVAGHREGREARYRVIPERLGVTARWMDRVAAAWDTRLSAIKRLAEGE
ncbi:putative ArsR family transcriptional regulator [Streptomyces lydicamycinicus]|uniref:Putative ArsR family transcriptional regulator n=1 Tax=Streptomyces lydicamycinicus TaxID=1546107 RepID=A0A0P4R7D0_9ACTN|nr:putative ArsR family transcriptional regulator [Streptomyces lydicamycinicus]